jgi:23S rRNA-intervening sequence protein
VSVSNSIAEGFERGTTQKLLSFLYIARGSAGEVRSLLWLVEGIAEFDDLKSQISNLRSQAESISRQLRGWADLLQNSEIRGQRYLDEKSRRRDKERRDREEFLNELEVIRKALILSDTYLANCNRKPVPLVLLDPNTPRFAASLLALPHPANKGSCSHRAIRSDCSVDKGS